MRPARRRVSPATGPAVRRAAVYVRVSTDEQAALEFNSLQAQEQICKTYISMRDADQGSAERWTYMDTYSDPGYSGGTLERPALKRLLDDIEAGRIDTLLVYKIDRLSRSIHQFYRVWELLEHHRVDLVCATQDLNTSTSQGKLMLNMLLSFGQFEREQISERTRDKIAAARKAGRWTGGHVPLGYNLENGRLVVNQTEAATVRDIFALYLKVRSLFGVIEELGRHGVRMKSGNHKNGTERGGAPFDKTSLLRLLRLPVYAGLVRCSGRLVKGAHEPIVDEETWNQVELLLTRNGNAGYQGGRTGSEALLKGLLYCAQCRCRMTPSYTARGQRRHRYYVCQVRLKKGARACPTGRVAAHVAEQQVIEQIRAIGRSPELTKEFIRQAKVQRDKVVAELYGEGKVLRRKLRSGLARIRRREFSSEDPIEIDGIPNQTATIECRLSQLTAEIETIKRASIAEPELRPTLEAFEPLWETLWPAERAALVRLLAVAVDFDGSASRIRGA